MTTHLSADVLTGVGPINARSACAHREPGDRITGCISQVDCVYCIAEMNVKTTTATGAPRRKDDR